MAVLARKSYKKNSTLSQQREVLMYWRIVLFCFGMLFATKGYAQFSPATNCEVRPGVSLSGLLYAYVDQATIGRSWEIAFEWSADGEVDEDRTIQVSWQSNAWNGTASWTAFGANARCEPENSTAETIADWMDRAQIIHASSVFPESVTEENVDVNAEVADVRLALYEVLSHETWVDALGIFVAGQNGLHRFNYLSWAINPVEDLWSVAYRFEVDGQTQEISWLVDLDEHEVTPNSPRSGLLWALFPPENQDPGSYSAEREYNEQPQPTLERLARSDVQRTIRHAHREINQCGIGEAARTYSISFVIQQDGAVTDISFTQDASRELAVFTCLQEAILELEFPAFSGEPVPITYPFNVGNLRE